MAIAYLSLPFLLQLFSEADHRKWPIILWLAPDRYLAGAKYGQGWNRQAMAVKSTVHEVKSAEANKTGSYWP